MSRKLKSYGLFAVFLILLGILSYLLKDIKTGNSSNTTQDNSATLRDAQYYNRLGMEYSRKRNFEKSLKAFNTAIKIAKNTKQFYVPYVGRAILKYRFKDCEGTMNDVKIAITSKDLSSSDRGSMFSLIGACKYITSVGNDNYKESFDLLSRAISLQDKDDPDLWQSYAYRGAVEIFFNDFENAKKDLFKALELNKDNYIIYNYLYVYNMKINNFKTALIYFVKASHFPTELDYKYYEGGSIIYQQLFYQATDEKNTEKIKEYGNLALENANKAYELTPNADSNFRVCEVKIALNSDDYLPICQASLKRAKEEKNDALYKEIYTLLH